MEKTVKLYNQFGVFMFFIKHKEVDILLEQGKIIIKNEKPLEVQLI